MQCLYCGKGIGPLRQLRDPEFCSEAHRTGYRERYRQQVYEALAPEPAPLGSADFVGQAVATLGPVPCAALCVLPKSPSAARAPAMPARTTGVFLERPDWLFGRDPAAMPTRLVYQDCTAAPRSPIPIGALSVGVEPPNQSTAGAAPTVLLAGDGTVRAPAAAPRIPESSRTLPFSLALPEVAQTRPPAIADLRSPLLHAATVFSGPATIGPEAHEIRAAIAHPSRLAIAGPTAPAASESAQTAGLSPAVIAAQPRLLEAGRMHYDATSAVDGALALTATIARPVPPAASVTTREAGPSPVTMASEPRPLEAGPLPPRDLRAIVDSGLPVAFESLGNRHIGIILPRPPAVSSSIWTDTIQHVLPIQPEPHLSVVAETSAHSAGASVGGRLPLLPDIEIARPEIDSAIRRPLGVAPPAHLGDPQPAPVPVAGPSWHADRTDLTNNQLGPLGSHDYPRVECSAAPSGALAGLVQPAFEPAAGSPDIRDGVAAMAGRTAITAPSPQLSALPPAIGKAPHCIADSLAPEAPRAAKPSWVAAFAAPSDHPLVPQANVVLPDCSPAPAGMVGEPGRPLAPGLGRAIRSCAVLWTLRVAHMFSPPFRMEPIRIRFNEVLRAGQGASYAGSPELRRNNLRSFKRPDAARLSKSKWQFIGTAAAAVLLAGVLRPQVADKNFWGSLPSSGTSVREWISKRATQDFADDFRGGLAQWKGVQPKSPKAGQPSLPKNWSHSVDGFIHPGQLALYRPSVPLSDYRFEFMAQVESQSVDWVVRAQDAENYYALKFKVIQPGPRPLVAMVHYPVIEGSQGSHVQTPLRIMIHANTPYRVTVEVKGNQYRAYVEGQEADYWTDNRLKTGGVGFFSEAGEHARVYWVKLESHGDLLGRICGLLSGTGGERASDKEKKAMDYRQTGSKDIKVDSGSRSADNGNSTEQEGRVSRTLSKAASLHLDGKLDEAAGELVRILDGGERHPALFFALGQLQYEMQEYGPAAQSYAQAAQLQPLHPTAHFNAGVCQGRIEHWEEAAASFRKAISNDPARIEAHLALGACLVQLGLHNEALDAYDRFLARHPDHDEALFGKAVALQKRDRSSEAVELYRRILSRNPNSEEALSNLVSLSLANQDYDQVRKYAQRLAEEQPKSQIALEGLAGAAFAAGDHQAAADYSRKLAELAPQVFENWFNLGVACHKAGDLANASEAYARATRVQSDSPQAHLNLGVALQEQGDLKSARVAYERALEIDPKLPGVHWNLGLVHEQSGDFDAAERLYAQVPANSPDSDDAAFRIGHLRLQRNDYPGSIEAFDACLVKRPKWPEARLNLGIAHWRAGDKEAARTCFQELTASGADSKEALRGLAALSLERQDYDKAFEIYRQLLDSGERTPELLYNAGLICQRRGAPEDAAVLYKEALKTDPGFGEALLNLGHALMSLGNEFEARSCWRKAVIAKPELAQRYFEPAAQAS